MDPLRLRAIKPFHELDAGELGVLAALATQQSLPAGYELMREGDFAYDLVGVLEGTVEVTSGGRQLAELGPGEILGEIGCLSRRPRSATVTATSPVRLIRLTHWDMRHLARRAPGALEAIRAIAEQRELLTA